MADVGRFLGQATEELAATVAADLVGRVGSAVESAARVYSRQLLGLAEVFNRNLADPSDLIRAHTDIARRAQQAVLASYAQTVTAREGFAGRTHYRAGATGPGWLRYAGGALRRALGSSEFFEATASGIGFVNIDLLDKEAAHWHRLNFGAGAAGSGSMARFEVTWGNLVVAALGYDEPASAAFVLPRGFWIGPEGERVAQGANVPGSDLFYPVREAKGAGFNTPHRSGTVGRASQSKVTRGIESRNFLDAGLRSIAEQLPVAYGQLYNQWWDASLRGAGPLTQVASVTPSRPYRLRAAVRVS